MIKEVHGVQLTCPNCQYEFSFNLGNIDSKIQELGQDIHSIIKQLAEYKTLSIKEQEEKKEWRNRTAYALAKKKEQLKKLKIKSKSVHDEVTRMNYHILKNVIKEFYGNEEFERCINEVIKRGESYNTSNVMGTSYTHSKGTVLKKI